MSLTIHLPSKTAKALEERAKEAGVTPEDFAERLLGRELTPREMPRESTLGEIAGHIVERFSKLPPEAFDGLPTDGAAEHDHYIYGTPKKGE